jgi:hemolysin activation/secretion protein
MRVSSLKIAIGLAASLSPVVAFAQAYERVAPKALPENPPPPPPTDTPQFSPLPSTDQVVLPALKGLVFIAGPEALRKEGLPDAAGISAPGLPLLAEPGFAAKVSPYIGGKVTMGDLDKIVEIAAAWYKDHGRPFVSITIPPQNITAGTVQLVVMQYRIGAVRPEGNAWFSSDLLVRESGLEPGQTLTMNDVQAGLERLNANPFRSVNTVFQPGKDGGTTDVILNTEDRLPLRLYASFDNAGTANLGRGEWSVGVDWGNAFGLDHQVSYQFTRSIGARFSAHSLSWTAPLPWGDRLLVFGSYEQETPTAGTFFNEGGNSGQAGLRYVRTLPAMNLGEGVGLTHDIQLGYDFKTTNNDLEFGGIQVFASAVEVDQFPIIYEATETDKEGQTAFSNQLVLSPGGLTAGNTDAAFHAADPRSGAAYVYDRLSLTRTTDLPAKFSFVTRVQGQLANGNLQSSEEQGLGGPGTVRGYYTDTAIASQGVLVSNEIRAPAVSLAKVVGQKLPVDDQFQLGAFWDWGHVSQVDPVPDQINSATLSSLGLDLHVTLDRYADFRFDTGWQLRKAPGADDRSVFTDIAIVVGF